MVSIADRKTGTILHAAFSTIPSTLSSTLCPALSQSQLSAILANAHGPCLTWAFLRESLYLRERARNINPFAPRGKGASPFALSATCTSGYDLTRSTDDRRRSARNGHLPIGLDTCCYRTDSFGLKGSCLFDEERFVCFVNS